MKYIRMHMVDAEPCTLGEWQCKTSHVWHDKSKPLETNGYKCDYPDGYSGWCPKEQFEKDSFSIDGEQGAPNAKLIFSALKTYHDRYYATPRAEKDSLPDRLIRAYYNEFVGRPNGCLTFGMAIEAMKSGKKVCRKGWNGKGMWLCVPLCDGPKEIPANGIWGKPNAEYAEQNGGTVKVLPYITMKTADGAIVMGWLASQTDILSEDWMIVE